MSAMAYEPPESLWKLVEENVTVEETSEIREILGDSLVDQSLELHAEIEALLDIWQSFRNDTDMVVPTSPRSLPEPPGMRESLRNHIRMLVENIREKARDADTVLSQHKTDILEYAMDSSSRGSSPGCLRSRPSSSFSSRSGRETPMRMTPSSEEDRYSSSTSASEKVDSVRDRLNVYRIDEVVHELRSTLQDEVSQLLTDIRFLQNCLEEENDFRSESRMSTFSEPSLQELREERSKLEKTSTSVPDSIHIISTLPAARSSLPGSPKHLKPLSPIAAGQQKIRPSPPPSAGKSARRTRTLPLKAMHPPGTINMTGTKDSHVQYNAQTGRILSGNSNINKVTGVRRLSSPSNNSNLTPTPMQPSPPSSAKRPTGSPTSNRLRQRFQNLPRQNSM